MDEALQRLDEAYALGEEELDLLLAENVEHMAEKAEKRGRLVAEAFRVNTDGLNDDSESRFLEKLKKLARQHGMLTKEARKLHQRLQDDLAKIKKEGKRVSAYHSAHRPTPLLRYRYLNKQS